MCLLRMLIASPVALTLIALGPIPVLGQASETTQSSPGDPGEVVVPTLGKPKGSHQAPVIHLPDPGIDPAPGHRDRRLEVLIPAGTGFPARLTDKLTSKTAQLGDRFQALLDQDLTSDGRVVVPRGSLLVGVVENAVKGGRIKGRAFLTVALEELQVGDGPQELTTNSVTIQAASSKKNDAKGVGVATGIGARVLTSRGQPAVIEKDQQLLFRLEEDTRIRVDPGPSIDL